MIAELLIVAALALLLVNQVALRRRQDKANKFFVQKLAQCLEAVGNSQDIARQAWTTSKDVYGRMNRVAEDAIGAARVVTQQMTARLERQQR
jgi:hypothetical protein